MISTNGVVVRVMENGKAEIVAEKKGACGSCTSAHSCHPSRSAMKLKTTVLNRANARPGDSVSITVSTASMMKSLALIYLFPVIGLMAGAILGANMAPDMSMSQTGGAILFGGAGLVVGFAAVIMISKKMASNDAYLPVITRVIKKGGGDLTATGLSDPIPQDFPCSST